VPCVRPSGQASRLRIRPSDNITLVQTFKIVFGLGLEIQRWRFVVSLCDVTSNISEALFFDHANREQI